MSHRVEEVPARIRYYWHQPNGQDLMGNTIKYRPALFFSREEVLQKIQESGGTLEEIVHHRGYFVVRDIGGHVVPGGDDLTQKQATDLAARLNQKESEEKAAQEQRIAEHQRQKDERERLQEEETKRRRLLDAHGAYSKNVYLKLAAAQESRRTIENLIGQWQLSITTQQAELSATNATIEILEKEVARIVQEQETLQARAIGEVR